MQRPLFPATLSVLITLAACSDQAPTPETAETPTPGTVAATAATTPPPPNTPETTAPTPSLEPTSTPRATSPTPAQDLDPVLSSLSEAEIDCIGGDPERTLAAFTGGAPVSMEEQAQLIGCLDDDTVDQLFMSTIIPVSLTAETSDCILAGLDVIDPRGVITAGLEGDPQTAMAGSMTAFTVALACLTDQEWSAASPRLGMEPEDRDGMVCVMAALGGSWEMATAMTKAVKAQDLAEGSALYKAGLKCGMEPRSESITTPEPVTETPMPKGTIMAPTPTVEPTREAPTPASTPSTPVSTPDPEPTRATATPAPTPHSTQSSGLWRGLVIAPENRCSPYDSDDYRYPQSVEARIVNAQGGIYGPYTGNWFNSTGNTDIEHILARSEAHDSGLCAASRSTRSQFASDLTLASPSVNRHQKSGKDITEWLTDLNQCWYVDRTIQVRLKYRLTIDRAEAEAADQVLATCESTAIVVLAPGTSTSAAPARNTAPNSTGDGSALDLYDDNGNGRITCAEARAHGIAPVHREHPAYEYMRDADGDGVVCE